MVRLTWTKPDNGGADVSEYRIYRGLSSGGEIFLNSTTAKNSYHDITANPATEYYYQIAAVNSAGEGSICNEVFVPPGVVPGADPCFVPGVTVAVDTLDPLPNQPPTAAVNIQSVSVAEPYGTDGTGQLVFTLQVGQAASAPPSSQWYVLWNRTNPDASFDRNYVAMKSDVAGALTFEYGKIAPPNANLPTRFGDADDGSYDPGSGTIRIAVSTSNVDGVVAGQTLFVMQARTFLARPDGLPVTSSASNDFSPEGAYTLVGNDSCRPNEAPHAELTRAPSAGCAPLFVSFDASASTDPDLGDTIASYQFDFGDGAPAVVQSSPLISHTYSAHGVFAARLLVTDSRGKISQNVDQEEVVIDPCAVVEVTPLLWSAGPQDTLTWPATPNAATYRLYRGVASDLPNLLTASDDSCVRFEGSATSTGPLLTETPAVGTFYWYLVSGLNAASVEGPAGNATGGPRIVNSTGACP